MRFARSVSAFDCRDPSIDRLVDTADLNVLQLDYEWPTNHPLGRHPSAGQHWKSYAPGFLEQLRRLHKALYLDPNLRLITNAGGGDTLGCVEAVAEFVCEHDNAELPITAIRGDNVLATLEELIADGVELRHISTGTPLHELTQPLLAAQIELGAGPLKVAFDEGSRIITAGCYDEAAPILAAAMSATPLTWERFDSLAQLANAAKWQKTVIEFDQDENLKMVPQRGFPTQKFTTQRLILESASADGTVHHADVCYQPSDDDLVHADRGVSHPKRIMGREPSGEWLLRVTYVAKYSAEAYWEFETNSNRNPATELFHHLKADLGYPDEDPCLEIHCMAPVDDISRDSAHHPAAPLMIRARYQSLEKKHCTDFVSAVKNYVARAQRPRHLGMIDPCAANEPPPETIAREDVGVSGGGTGPMRSAGINETLPEVRCRTAQFCCPVPREAIPVSVDTRPAKEWR